MLCIGWGHSDPSGRSHLMGFIAEKRTGKNLPISQYTTCKEGQPTAVPLILEEIKINAKRRR